MLRGMILLCETAHPDLKDAMQSLQICVRTYTQFQACAVTLLAAYLYLNSSYRIVSRNRLCTSNMLLVVAAQVLP